MCEFLYDDIKLKFGSKSRLLFTDNDVSCMKLKPKMFAKILKLISKCLILVNIQLSQNIMMAQTN